MRSSHSKSAYGLAQQLNFAHNHFVMTQCLRSISLRQSNQTLDAAAHVSQSASL